jgi:hypothetical protein
MCRGTESGIHGHDLTLGTAGDGIFDNKYLCVTKLFVDDNSIHCAATDCTNIICQRSVLGWWPGLYFIRNPQTIAGLQFVISGEHKDVDRFRGKPAEDTGITSVFVGPRAVASWRRWSAELDVDLPVLIDNTALQVVPDYRLRAGISLQF